MTAVLRESSLRRVALLVGVLWCAIQLPATARDTALPEPVPPPAAVRNAFELDPFYRQWIDMEGMPVVASARVSPQHTFDGHVWLAKDANGTSLAVFRASETPGRALITTAW